MLTSPAATEAPVQAGPVAAPIAGIPEREATWPWVSPGPSGNGRGVGGQAGGAGFMPGHALLHPPPRRKMPRLGRWCNASTSCRASARRPSAAWRSHVRRLQQLEETHLVTVALLQVMGSPELAQEEDSQQKHQLKTKVIKTMEEISEALQDLRFDAESTQ
ncbi:required for excision 1-B domain-containing protein isoform X2 [Sorex fumeus]|uniref:required for excision 1-B domain-containing protein isoform X2 n=1 Tax=Sorex fumeus TaxID=62283 RepID=UPI0024ACC2D2|nr:required for excision 1-B domain-containing protein isoform X2 [Sorex fumeus]